MYIQPYLFFEGRCEEAIEFYRATLGAEVQMLMRFSEAPDQSPGQSMVQPQSANKIMHATLQIGDSIVLLSDGRCSGNAAFSGAALSLSTADDNQAARLFAALAKGGQVMMPLEKTFFASSFGMLADRFGVQWMVLAGQPA